MPILSQSRFTTDRAHVDQQSAADKIGEVYQNQEEFWNILRETR
jgi:hypothetical protein